MVDEALCHAHRDLVEVNSTPYLTILAFHYFSQPIHNEELLRKLYLDMDFSSYQISEFSGWSRTSISDALRDLEISKDARKGPLPKYGEKIEGEKRVPHQGEQKVIKQMLSLRNKGLSFAAIATQLNKKKTPTKRGGNWNKSTIKDIINRNLNEEV